MQAKRIVAVLAVAVVSAFPALAEARKSCRSHHSCHGHAHHRARAADDAIVMDSSPITMTAAEVLAAEAEEPTDAEVLALEATAEAEELSQQP